MEIEEAKSGRSHCTECGDKISLDSMRFFTVDYNYGTHNKRFRCLKCAKEFVESDLIEKRELLNKIKWHLQKES